MNLICPSCKTENPSIAIFCSNCGYNLKQFKERSDLELLQESLAAKDYKVERRIDGGTQSDPFLCEYIPTGEKFVIRLLKKDQPEDLRDLFITGINLNAQLDHPNILKVKEVGMLGERPYFISKYADNGTLSWLLNTYGTKGMPIEEAIGLTIKILKGLHEIHEQNVIHRNLKPDAIFTQKNGEPVIGEFGLAKQIEDGNKIKSENLVGTLEYMSPERCKLKRVDRRSDIYSVGIMLYQLLTGELPFTGDTQTLIFKQTNEVLPTITYKLLAKGLNSIISGKEKLYLAAGEIQAILEKACKKGPSSRYNNAIEFANVLEKFLTFVSTPSQTANKENRWKALNQYRADHNANVSDDRLGITNAVDAFARLISAKSVHPPLSIGLFGNWGAGKSFFMSKLSKEIERLTKSMRSEAKAGVEQSNLAFYGNIVQIEFNTWHFVDANLWASLVNHIFSNLRIKGEPVDEVKERRNFLIKRIESEKNGLLDLEKDEEKFSAKVNDITAEIEKESVNYKSVIYNLFDKSFDSAIKEKISPDEIKEWCKKAGIEYNPDEPIASQMQRIYAESDKFKSLPLLEQVKSRYKGYLYFGIVVLILFLLGVFWATLSYLLNIFFGSDWIDKITKFSTDLLLSVIGSITAMLAPVYPIYVGLKSWATKYLNWSPQFFKKIKDTIPDLNAELEKKEKEKEKKLADLEAKKKTFEEKKENARSEIQKLESDLDKTSDGDYLSTFIKGRMGTDEYTKHLGLQAKIRTDFEQLSNLIEKYNKSMLAGEVKDNDGYMINRIVLYIDDLDRCPPDKVVEVLQAVHLLLSFPAFVVVVAVDARWVSQSLRIGYKDLFGQDDSADIDGDGIPDSFRATPHDYLEKIFQIPFWLYPMNIEGRRNLLTQLMESNLESEPAKESNPLNDVNSNKIVVSERIMANSEAVNINANSDISKNISGLERKDSLNPTLLNEIQTESKDASSNLTESDSSEEFPFKLEESAADAEQLTIKREESDFSLTLAPILGFSPRALKRFVNVYLLIKVGLSDLQWRIYYEKVHPKTGEKDAVGTIRNFQAVMFLLAVITGLPATSRILFRTLRTKTLRTLGELFEQMDVKKKDDKWYILGSPADEISIKRKMVERGLTDILPKTEITDLNLEVNKYNMEIELLQFTKWLDREKRNWFEVDLDQLRYWDPVVSRYSFRVEPIDQD
ncbi:MAG TPA: P-loop NTPase fold protein [Leptospiraceae bacterium]|nr:P-loop NTPase fold protein [Leptospiraceae bacterium]